MGKYFNKPFAVSGEKGAIPNDTQPGGDMSYEQGFSSDYQADQTSDPNAKDIDRQQTNQLYNDITSELKIWQEQGLRTYSTDVNFGVDARTLASDGNIYRAKVANGPGNGGDVSPIGNPATWENTTLNDIFAQQSLGTNGYQYYPGVNGQPGLIEQWGYVSSAVSDGDTISFNITFPNNCFNVSLTDRADSAAAVGKQGTRVPTTSGFVVHIDGAGPVFYWRAIGN